MGINVKTNIFYKIYNFMNTLKLGTCNCQSPYAVKDCLIDAICHICLSNFTTVCHICDINGEINSTPFNIIHNNRYMWYFNLEKHKNKSQKTFLFKRNFFKGISGDAYNCCYIVFVSVFCFY